MRTPAVEDWRRTSAWSGEYRPARGGRGGELWIVVVDAWMVPHNASLYVAEARAHRCRQKREMRNIHIIVHSCQHRQLLFLNQVLDNGIPEK